MNFAAKTIRQEGDIILDTGSNVIFEDGWTISCRSVRIPNGVPNDVPADFDLSISNTDPSEMVVYNDKFYILNITEAFVYVFNSDGTRSLADEFALESSNTNPAGIEVYNDKFYILDSTALKAFVYNIDSTRSVDDDFDLHADNANPITLILNNGLFYVLDSTDLKFYVYSPIAGVYISADDFTFTSTNGNVSAITVYDDKFYVLDDIDDKVYVYDADGTRSASDEFDLTTSDPTPNGIAFYNNKFYVTDISDGTVYVYNIDGTRSTADDFNLGSANGTPSDIAAYNNKFYVIDSIDDKIYVYNIDGTRSAADDFDLHADNTSPTGLIVYEDKFYVTDSTDDKVFVYDSDGTRFLDDEFDLTNINSTPNGIVIYDNKLYVGDTADNKVYAYSNKGTRITANEFNLTTNNADPVAGTMRNNVFFVVDTDFRVYSYTSTGTYSAANDFDLETINANPAGMAESDDVFYVVDSTDFKVYAYNSSGTYISTSDFDFNYANTNAVDIITYDDKLYVLDDVDDKVYVYNIDGTRSIDDEFDLIVGNDNPSGITVHNNKFYVTDITDSKVFVYNIDGTRSASDDFFFVAANTNAIGITSYNNKLYILDSTDNKVYVYDADGTRSASDEFDLTTNNANAVAITIHDDIFYVTDSTDNKAYAYNSSGTYSSGDDFDFTTNNANAAGITIHNDIYYVLDSTDNKVYIYTASNTPAKRTPTLDDDYNLVIRDSTIKINNLGENDPNQIQGGKLLLERGKLLNIGSASSGQYSFGSFTNADSTFYNIDGLEILSLDQRLLIQLYRAIPGSVIGGLVFVNGHTDLNFNAGGHYSDITTNPRNGDSDIGIETNDTSAFRNGANNFSVYTYLDRWIFDNKTDDTLAAFGINPRAGIKLILLNPKFLNDRTVNFNPINSGPHLTNGATTELEVRYRYRPKVISGALNIEGAKIRLSHANTDFATFRETGRVLGDGTVQTGDNGKFIGDYTNIANNIFTTSSDGLFSENALVRTRFRESTSSTNNAGILVKFTGDFTREIRHYNYNEVSASYEFETDSTTPFENLVADNNVTAQSKTTVLAYTSIDNWSELYDYIKAQRSDYNTTVPLPTNVSGQLTFTFNLILDNTASSVFSWNGTTNTLTVKSGTSFVNGSKYTQGNTSGSVTAVNGTTIDAALKDVNGVDIIISTNVNGTNIFYEVKNFDNTSSTGTSTIDADQTHKLKVLETSAITITAKAPTYQYSKLVVDPSTNTAPSIVLSREPNLDTGADISSYVEDDVAPITVTDNLYFDYDTPKSKLVFGEINTKSQIGIAKRLFDDRVSSLEGVQYIHNFTALDRVAGYLIVTNRTSSTDFIAYDDADGAALPDENFNNNPSNINTRGVVYNDGFIYVLDLNRTVYAYNAETKNYDSSKNFTIDTENTAPEGIAYYDNHFYVLDATDDKVYAYTSSGTHVPQKDFDLHTDNGDPTGITFYDNHFYVPDATDNKVYAYDVAGTQVSAKEFNLDTANDTAASIVFSDDHFFVGQFDNDTLYAYTADGTYTSSRNITTASSITVSGLATTEHFTASESLDGEPYEILVDRININEDKLEFTRIAGMTFEQKSFFGAAVFSKNRTTTYIPPTSNNDNVRISDLAVLIVLNSSQISQAIQLTVTNDDFLDAVKEPIAAQTLVDFESSDYLDGLANQATEIEKITKHNQEILENLPVDPITEGYEEIKRVSFTNSNNIIVNPTPPNDFIQSVTETSEHLEIVFRDHQNSAGFAYISFLNVNKAYTLSNIEKLIVEMKVRFENVDSSSTRNTIEPEFEIALDQEVPNLEIGRTSHYRRPILEQDAPAKTVIFDYGKTGNHTINEVELGIKLDSADTDRVRLFIDEIRVLKTTRRNVDSFKADTADAILARKLLSNRKKVDTTDNTRIVYNDDGTTALTTFDLKDTDGNASTDDAVEEDPQ